ncbi:MAG: electron transfer flavoprotein subunit beta [Actinobacteria bacterium]|nr:electron transfer flavoprotein subunit beta [Actinomycetota bacterium]
MTVLVAIKAVATVDEEFELADDGLDVAPEFVERELNEWDSYAVEAALRLRESGALDEEIVLVTVGDEDAEEALRAGLAMGADRAVRVWDDSLPGVLGPLAAARLLAAVAAEMSPSLVLCGAQSADAAYGATGVALAAYLKLPHAAVVRELSYSADAIEVTRELEGGLLQRLRLRTPAVLTVQTGINEPRYATLRAIKQAEAKELDLTDPASLGVAIGDLPEAVLDRVYVPAVEGAAEMLEGTPDEVAARIAEVVEREMAA